MAPKKDKGGNTKSSKTAGSAAAAGAAGVQPAVEAPKSYVDTLTPEERELELKKQEERQKKAEDEKRKQEDERRRREWREQEEKKKKMEEKRVTQQWERELNAVKEKAKQDGVLTAEDWGDGLLWVKLPDNKWINAEDKYYCTACEKHLNDSNLGSHLEGQTHKKKMEWKNWSPGASSAEPAPPPPAAPRATSSLAPAPAPAPGPALGMPLLLSRAYAGHLEPWMEMSKLDGVVRCVPCGKVLDECHMGTRDHENRVERWTENEERKSQGFAAPELPYLAWVPVGDGERWLKCLLCDKWVQDESSHVGTFQKPAGSKDHVKKLQNYPPGSSWYEEQVTRAREKYHPTQGGRAAAPTPARSTGGPPPAFTSTPAPWANAGPPAASRGAAPTPAPWAAAAAPPAASRGPAPTPATWAAGAAVAAPWPPGASVPPPVAPTAPATSPLPANPTYAAAGQPATAAVESDTESV